MLIESFNEPRASTGLVIRAVDLILLWVPLKISLCGCGEMAQWTKCLLHELRALNLDPPHPHQKLVVEASTGNTPAHCIPLEFCVFSAYHGQQR